MSRLALTPGYRLYATPRGLIAIRDRATLIDLGHRRVERDLVQLLRRRRDLCELAPDLSPTSRSRIVDVLVERGVLRPAVVGDGASHRGLVPDLVGDLFDRRFAAVLATAGRGCELIAAWSAGATIVLVYDDGIARPCAACAALFDRAAFAGASPSRFAAEIEAAMERDDWCGADPEETRQAVARWLPRGSSLPTTGKALVLDPETGEAAREWYDCHPSCACAVTRRYAPAIETTATAEWESLARRRFAPVICLDRGDVTRPARVAYRRSRGIAPVHADHFGIAHAGGEDAPERAIAEAIERFCMLHAPPDRRAATLDEIEDLSLDESQLQTLLFRDEERDTAGFRFPRFTRDLPLDWSWARHAVHEQRVLVPTSLVGRVPEGSVRLVDATSNGYAAHRHRRDAVERAILEVIERDAVLRAWYLRLALPELEAVASCSTLPGHRVSARLATQDVDVPVVWLLATSPDGALRSASAAALSIDEAFRRAVGELESGLGDAVAPEACPSLLDDATRRHGPRDHLLHYRRSGSAAIVDDLPVSGTTSLEDLRWRWPRKREDEGLSGVLRALRDSSLDAWIVDRSLPGVFGRGWHVVRALIPGMTELSWGHAYRRLASGRIAAELTAGRRLNPHPHPFA